jgi:Arc/MetJ-type ribon-helix-helix transcriptional regulator
MVPTPTTREHGRSHDAELETRLTVRVTDDQEDLLDSLVGDDSPYNSRSEALRAGLEELADRECNQSD